MSADHWPDATLDVLSSEVYLQDYIFDGVRGVSREAVRKLAGQIAIGAGDLHNWTPAHLHFVLLTDADPAVRERARVEFLRRFEAEHSPQIADRAWELQDAEREAATMDLDDDSEVVL